MCTSVCAHERMCVPVCACMLQMGGMGELCLKVRELSVSVYEEVGLFRADD